MKLTFPEPPEDGAYEKLANDWFTAAAELRKFREIGSREEIKKLEAELKEKRRLMDLYNRYTISIRGASSDVYGILKKAKIEKEFRTLLQVTMPSPEMQVPLVQEMKPLEHLERGSACTSWMSEY